MWLLIYTLCSQRCLSSSPLKCLLFIYLLIDWFTSIYATDFFLPLVFPLSHRFQLYLQTTWLVTSMLRRCRTLTLNGMCPLVVSPSTVHTLLFFWWLEIAWPQLKKTLNCCFNEYFALVCSFASRAVYFPLCSLTNTNQFKRVDAGQTFSVISGKRLASSWLMTQWPYPPVDWHSQR